MEELLSTDLVSDPMKAAICGALVGALFGAFAQSSRFCLRSATLEFWSGTLGPSVAVWLAVFGSALLGTQLLMLDGALGVTEVRQISVAGTLSGAIIGGLMFGVGMILARGCASRLLVLSATGNMRAVVSGLIVTVVAQASLTGLLSPLRQSLSQLWVVGPGVRGFAVYLPAYSGIWLGVATLIFAAVLTVRAGMPKVRALIGAGVGLAVALGWWLTAALTHVSFEPVSVGSVTFTGPSANTLMALITEPSLPLSFGIGLVPGVVVGSFVSSLVRREFALQAFNSETGMARYMIGAPLMGFGGMLAGGCAVGAGITGGSVLSLTAWVALLFMWIGAGLAQLVMGRIEARVGSGVDKSQAAGSMPTGPSV